MSEHLVVGVVSLIQLLIWTLFFGSPYWPEWFQRGSMILASVFSLFVSAFCDRGKPYCASAILHIGAIVIYFLTPLLWYSYTKNPEIEEGFLLIVYSGLIIAVILPPVLNAVVCYRLFALSRKLA